MNHRAPLIIINSPKRLPWNPPTLCHRKGQSASQPVSQAQASQLPTGYYV